MAALAAPDENARSTNGARKVADTAQPGCPNMPGGPPGLAAQHDHLIVDPSRSLLAMMTRTTTQKEISMTPAASQSFTDEAFKLVQEGAWDPKEVREWQNVADEAREKC